MNAKHRFGIIAIGLALGLGLGAAAASAQTNNPPGGVSSPTNNGNRGDNAADSSNPSSEQNLIKQRDPALKSDKSTHTGGNGQ